MRGHIERRGNGYRITVRLGKDEDTGKYVRVSEQVNGKNLRDAREKAEKRITQILSEYDKGTFILSHKITVREYLKDWLDSTIKPNRERKTYVSYKSICDNYLIPRLGKLKLASLRKRHLQTLYNDKKEAGLTRTVELMHSVIHKALKDAIPDYIVRNVADEVERPKYNRPEPKILTKTDVHIYTEFVRETGYYHLFYTYIFTGSRRSELLALRRMDVNLDAGQININQNLDYVNKYNYTFKAPKTDKSKRCIDLTPSNAQVLKEYIEQMDAHRKSLNLPDFEPKDLVFCHIDGSPLPPDTVTHAWMKLVKRCGLDDIHLHSARHTMASHLLAENIPIAVVSERLGHSLQSTTLNIYNHLIPGMQREAAKKLDEALLPPPPPQSELQNVGDNTDG